MRVTYQLLMVVMIKVRGRIALPEEAMSLH